MAKPITRVDSIHSPGEDQPAGSDSGSGKLPTLDDFEAIYRQNYAPIWRFLVHLGVRKMDVPDVTHNVFLIAHRKLPEFQGRSSVRTWLCGIALRVGRDFMRSAPVRLEVSVDDALEHDTAAGEDSSEALRRKRRLALALRLLDALPAEQREVFVLHELEQLSGPEIAELMGTPANTVRSRLKRARSSFSERLAELRAQGELDV